MIPEDELDTEDQPERTPHYHLAPDEVAEMDVDYSTRAPGDWVISGPLGTQGGGPGRRFMTAKLAEKWVREKYGTRVKWRIKEASRSTTNLADAEMRGGNRWAWLIKGAA